MRDYPTYAETMRRIMEPHERVARMVAARMMTQHVISNCAWGEDFIDHRDRFMQFVLDRCGKDCHFHLDSSENRHHNGERLFWLFDDPRDALMIKMAWQDGE